MSETAYERGAIDGKVAAQLENHEHRLDRIDAMLLEVGRDLNALVLATQHLEEAAKADKETAIATAKALADADAARRKRSDDHWTPLQRLLAVVTGLGGLTGWAYMVVQIFQQH